MSEPQSGDPETEIPVPDYVTNWKENERANRARKRATTRPAAEPASPAPVGPSLPLSAREETVSILFAEGHTADEIGLVLGLSVETVRSYLVRARLKYQNADRPATNKLQLRARLAEDGYLNE